MIEFADGLNYGRTGREKNKKAMQWYEKAALHDDTGMAYLRMGQQKGNGDGMKTDIDESISLFTKAGDLGQSFGYVYAGHLNYYSKYDQVNYSQAIIKYEKAAKEENANGVFHLALMNYYGQGTIKKSQQSI